MTNNIITAAKDLVTQKTDTMNGFIEQAKEKRKDIIKYTKTLNYFLLNPIFLLSFFYLICFNIN